MANFIILTILICTIYPSLIFANNEGIISKTLLEDLKINRVSDIMVSMRGGTSGFLKDIETKSSSNRGQRAAAIRQRMMQRSASSQSPLSSFLNRSGVKYESFWISNEVNIPAAPSSLVQQIANIRNVQGVRLNENIPLFDPIPTDNNNNNSTNVEKQLNRNLAWGVERIEADKAWRYTRGRGAIVAIIDTGANANHEALINNFVGLNNYGWYDPFTKSSRIVDENGHGTHCAGSVLGQTRGIGVAPDARWMACRGCQGSSCSGAALAACGQFTLCPHDTNGQNPDCSKHPDIVSNSWGNVIAYGNPSYDSIIDAWVAAEIIPVFAMGNSGPACVTGGYPGVNAKVIGVGATNQWEGIAEFSSKGPHFTPTGNLTKPDISAPGADINSAAHNSNNGYSVKSGTSMACPHVSGVAALLRSLNPRITIEEVKKAIFETAETRLVPASVTCGNDLMYPNHAFGHGRISALKAVERVARVSDEGNRNPFGV